MRVIVNVATGVGHRRSLARELLRQGRRNVAADRRARRGQQDLQRAVRARSQDDATPEKVKAVIGNGSWTHRRCDGCGQQVRKTATVVEDYGNYDKREEYCLPCLQQAVEALKPESPSAHRNPLERLRTPRHGRNRARGGGADRSEMT